MRIGILTSGGDSPGMNAAVRSAVRTGTALGHRMFGVERGYAGLIDGKVIPLDNRAVGGIIERGGTMLHTARSPAFMTAEGQERALATIGREQLDAMIIVGGDGSLRGALCLEDHGVPTVGIPASIDNDVYGTSMAIGVDTALNTVVDNINRIRDTAISHERAFVIEVMGRSSGYIGLMAGLAGGAEIVLIPEAPMKLDWILQKVKEGLKRGKYHSIIVVAEGFVPEERDSQGEEPIGRTVSRFLEESGSIETRLTILGHLQRGGSPTAFDRILACRLGAAASKLLSDGNSGVMAAVQGQKLATVPLSKSGLPAENIDLEIYKLVYTLAN